MYNFYFIGSCHAMLIAICQSSKFVTSSAVLNNTIFTLEEMMKMERFATSIIDMVHGGCENTLSKERTGSTMPKGGSRCTENFKTGARRVGMLVKHPYKLVMCDLDREMAVCRRKSVDTFGKGRLCGKKASVSLSTSERLLGTKHRIHR